MGHSKGLALPALLTLETHETRVHGADVESIAADRHAPARELAVVGILADVEIDAPALLARLGIERDDDAARRGEIQAAVGVDRCGFEGRPLRSAGQGSERGAPS